jgi:hypothetical protein
MLKYNEKWLLVFKNSARRCFLALGPNGKIFLAQVEKMLDTVPYLIRYTGNHFIILFLT